MDSDITSLLNSTNVDTSSLLPSGFGTLFTIFMIVTIVLSVIITVLYVLNVVTTYRAHKASIETRDILREMNERDKQRLSPTQRPNIELATAPSTQPNKNDMA